MKALLLAGMLLIAAATAYSQTPGTLRVQFVDPDGKPLAGASLYVLQIGRTATCDSATGSLILAGLDPGVYEAEIRSSGKVLDVMRFTIAPLRITDIGAIRIAPAGAERCLYQGMFHEPWTMSRIGPHGERIATGSFATFEVEMGCWDATGR